MNTPTQTAQKILKGCGIEVCAVTTHIDGKVNDEPDIQMCGEFCPYHKEVHYCEKCEKAVELANG